MLRSLVLKSYTLIACAFAALLINGGMVIYWQSNSDPPGGFKRHYLPDPKLLHRAVKLGKIIELAGATSGSFYFSTDTPGKLVVTDHQLNFVKQVSADVGPDIFHQTKIYHFTKVQYSSIYIFLYNLPGILKCSLTGDSCQLTKLDKGGFSTAAIISGMNVALRKVKIKKRDQYFQTVNLRTGAKTLEEGISASYGDGGLITDGILHFDTSQRELLYLNYYRNKFILLDTGLRSYRSYRTIDTFEKFRVQPYKQASRGSNNFTIPGFKKVINPLSTISDGILFVNSSIRADNDDLSKFRNSIVIDLYKTKNGEYVGSFAVTNKIRKKIKRIHVIDNILITIDDEYLNTFLIDSAVSKLARDR